MSPILITGATGHVGMHLVHLLHEKGYAVRALVRDHARAANLPHEVEVVMGDLAHPETLPAAFAGVERVFLMVAGHGLDHTRNAVAAASWAGMQRIVNLSSIGAGFSPTLIMGREFAEREAIIQESRIAWTFLRPSNFMSNALWWLPSLKAEGVVRDPVGPGRCACIDTDDIAAVAAVALTQEGHTGQVYTLTGNEAADGAATGRDPGWSAGPNDQIHRNYTRRSGSGGNSKRGKQSKRGGYKGSQ